jgi:polysaccharide pyruvyl transferase WcaK-like protein
VRQVAAAVDRLIGELDVDVVFFVTQVMDGGITAEVLDAVRQRDRVFRADNPRYDFEELAGILGRVELLVGMRTHSLILACSVGTPIVNLNAYPKSKNFIDTVGLGGFSLEIDDVSEDALCAITRRAWAERQATRAGLAVAVAREKAKALASVAVIGRVLGWTAEPSARARAG